MASDYNHKPIQIHDDTGVYLFNFLHAASIVLKIQQSQHEIADALLRLNYSSRAQLALPKIDERQGVSYSFVIH